MPSTVPLHLPHAARACNSSWELMAGDGRKRRCSNCCQDVYKVEGLARSEALALVTASEGEQARLYRRADGTVMTSNCSGSRAAVRRSRVKAAAVAAAAALLIVGLGVMATGG